MCYISSTICMSARAQQLKYFSLKTNRRIMIIIIIQIKTKRTKQKTKNSVMHLQHSVCRQRWWLRSFVISYMRIIFKLRMSENNKNRNTESFMRHTIYFIIFFRYLPCVWILFSGFFFFLKILIAEYMCCRAIKCHLIHS